MEIGWALFYGLIQGVSEFLPISSSGHLALIPFFMELKDPGVLFDLFMHLGTAIAVILYFWKEILDLLKQMKCFIFRDKSANTSFFQNFVVSTICTFVLILILKKYAFEYGRTPLLIGINFIAFGVLMYLSDRRSGKDVDLIQVTKIKVAALIGLSQALAIFPGVSRSGVTLTMARTLQMSRLQASRYSFLLSLPIILGSIAFKLPEIFSGEVIPVPVETMIAGVIFSFVFGLLTIHFFLKLIANLGLAYFAIYRCLVGTILIYLSLFS